MILTVSGKLETSLRTIFDIMSNYKIFRVLSSQVKYNFSLETTPKKKSKFQLAEYSPNRNL